MNVTYPRLQKEHTLMISDCYFTLRGEHLKRFHTEPRYEYSVMGKEVCYSPDALFSYKGKAYILEIQLKPLSKLEWVGKNKNAETFFNKGYFEKIFQENYGRVFIPHFITLTNQPEESARSGFNVDGRSLQVIKDIKEMLT